MLVLVNRRVAVVSIESIQILPAKFDVRRTVNNTIKKEDGICLPVEIKIKLVVYYNKEKEFKTHFGPFFHLNRQHN